MQPVPRPVQSGSGGEAGIGRQRVDREILEPRMPPRRPDLQDFDDADHHDGNRRREQPMPRIGQTEGQPDQNECERMLAVTIRDTDIPLTRVTALAAPRGRA